MSRFLERFNQQALLKHIQPLDQVELRMLQNFASVAEQVMVKELLFHFALQEGFDCLLEIRLIALVDKEVELMAVMV